MEFVLKHVLKKYLKLWKLLTNENLILNIKDVTKNSYILFLFKSNFFIIVFIFRTCQFIRFIVYSSYHIFSLFMRNIPNLAYAPSFVKQIAVPFPHNFQSCLYSIVFLCTLNLTCSGKGSML